MYLEVLGEDLAGFGGIVSFHELSAESGGASKMIDVNLKIMFERLVRQTVDFAIRLEGEIRIFTHELGLSGAMFDVGFVEKIEMEIE